MSYVSKTSVDGVPWNAVIGGYTADDFPLYIVWPSQTGNLDARNDYAEYIDLDDNASNSTDWMYMIVEYSE